MIVMENNHIWGTHRGEENQTDKTENTEKSANDSLIEIKNV